MHDDWDSASIRQVAMTRGVAVPNAARSAAIDRASVHARRYLIALAMIASPWTLAHAQNNRCGAELEPLIQQGKEIRAAFEPAEYAEDRTQACRLARFYVENLDRIQAAYSRLPPACAPANIAVKRQLVGRDRIAWLGKIKRHCAMVPGAAPPTQHKVLKVP